MRRRFHGIVLAALASACGGASESRVSALEARVAKLAPDGVPAADKDRLDRLEQQLSVVQRDVANAEQRRADGPAAPVAPTPTVIAVDAPSRQAAPFDAVTWANVDTLLGADAGGVTAGGDGYTVQRVWLARETAALQIPGRAPKLAPAPGGLVVRLVKPKSFAAQLGLQNADIITAIDEHPVASAADLSSALHAAHGGHVRVKVLRKKRELQLDYKLVD